MSVAVTTAAVVAASNAPSSMGPALWFLLAIVGMPFWYVAMTKNPMSNMPHVYYALYCYALFPTAIYLAKLSGHQ